MTGFDRVLLATDFSERSENAMQRVRMLVENGVREIRLLHVVSGTLLDDLKHLVAGGVSNRLREALEQKLSEQAGRLQDGLDVAVEYALEVGRPHVVIIEQGKQTDSLIVVGAHTRAMHDWVRGSMLERMLGAGRQPMLVVRQPANEPYRKVLVPIDFSPCSAAAVEAAIRLAPDAEITLLHVHALPFESKLRFAGISDKDMAEYRTAGQRQAEKELADFLQKLDLQARRVTSRLAVGHPPEVILETIDHERCDLVVMGRYGKSGPSEILLGSVTEYVATVGDCDIMVVSL
jgi:nucleotide-binding universal stress UspA family protein